MSAGATLASGALVNALAFLSSNLRAIFTFLIARWLGSASLGAFGVAWAIADLASKFGTLGLDYSVIPFVARSEAAGDRGGSRRIWRRALLVAVPSSVLVALVGFAAARTGPEVLGLRADLGDAASVMLLGVPGMVLYRVCNGLSRGMKVMRHDVYSRGMTESLGTTLAFVLALLVGARQLAPVLAAVVGTWASGLVAFALARRLYQADSAPRANRRPDPAAGLIRGSLPIAAYDLLNIGIMRVDVIMLGVFAGRAPNVTLETVGVYAACVEVAGGLRKLSQAFTPIFTPVLAEQLAAGDVRAAEASYAYVARWMLALLLPALVLLLVSGGAILSLFGPGFATGAPWLAIAGAACALNAFVGLGETILMIERPNWNVFNTIAAFAAAIVLNLLLIPRYGPIGAALSMLVPYVIQGLLRGAEISRLLAWQWPWRALARPWIAAVVALAVGLTVRTLTGSQATLAAGLLALAAYLGVWGVLGLEAEDRAVLARLRG